MKKAILVVRVLLGLVFVFFGLNNILQFMHVPLPPGDAGVFLVILVTHKYMTFVALLQIIAGLLLLVGRYVPLALTLLAPIIVNILLFHLTIAHEGVLPGLVTAILELFLLWHTAFHFAGSWTRLLRFPEVAASKAGELGRFAGGSGGLLAALFRDALRDRPGKENASAAGDHVLPAI